MSSPCGYCCRRPTLTDSWTNTAVKSAASATHQGSRVQSHVQVSGGRGMARSSIVLERGLPATPVDEDGKMRATLISGLTSPFASSVTASCCAPHGQVTDAPIRVQLSAQEPGRVQHDGAFHRTDEVVSREGAEVGPFRRDERGIRFLQGALCR